MHCSRIWIHVRVSMLSWVCFFSSSLSIKSNDTLMLLQGHVLIWQHMALNHFVHVRELQVLPTILTDLLKGFAFVEHGRSESKCSSEFNHQTLRSWRAHLVNFLPTCKCHSVVPCWGLLSSNSRCEIAHSKSDTCSAAFYSQPRTK